MKRQWGHLWESLGGLVFGTAAAYRLQKFLSPPKFDGWIRVYPTLACNLNCNYCVNQHFPPAYRGHEFSLLKPKQWSDALNRIGRHVILTGGEPFLYPGIVELLNTIDPGLQVKIYTNFSSPNILSLMKQVKRPVLFFGSYHPCSGPPEHFLHTINELRALGKFQGTIHGIATAKQKKFLRQLRKRFQAEGWNLILDVDQYRLFPGASMRFRRSVECTRRLILIAPDGQRYHCVSKMVRRDTPLGSILDQDPEPERLTLLCHDYGYCAPCDGLGETQIRLC